MRRTALAMIVVLAGLALLPGDTPPPKPTIEQLIDQLDDKDFKVRQAAEKAIEEMGPEALPALRKALEAKPSLEVAQRIEKWIPQFELAALTRPKLITLNVTGRPLQEVVDQIAKQTGFPVTLTPREEREKKPYDFKFERVTLWEALDQLSSAAELTVGRDAEQKGLQLTFSDKHQPFVHRHGAFRVVGTGFHYSYSKQRSNHFALVARKPADGEKQGQSNEAESLQFTLQVEAEPGLPVLGLGEVVVTEATDNRKQSVVPEAAPNRLMFGRRGVFASSAGGGLGGLNLHGWAQLKPPSKGASTIAVLKGTVMVHLEKAKETTVMAEKVLEAKGKKFKFGETSLEVDEVKKGDNGEVDLYLSMRGGQAGEGELGGEVQLLDDKGNVCPIGRSGLSSDGTTARMHLTFIGQGGTPTKLVCVKRVTADYSLPFEFRDLPLP